MSQGSWNHIVFVIEDEITVSGDRGISAYINGVKRGSAYKNGDQASSTSFSKKLDDQVKNPPSQDGVGLRLGPYRSNQPLEARIDEFSLWNFALTQNQISILYNGGAAINAMVALTQSA